ncbi:HAD family hydrolase [Tenacibaculum sp. 190524A02b]|uniref:HAD family hydrolase n=1 Tax=Tenacibaculum vairaonense TaxID=3137860 RepID=UPI0032B18913
MKKKNLIVFDIDGTLTDSVKIHQKAFTEMLYKIGVSRINSEFKTFKHHTDSFIAKEIYETDKGDVFSKSKIIEFEQGLTEKISAEKIEEIKGAQELINTIEKNTEFGICFATGSLLRPAKHKLNSIKIDYNEELLIASDEIYSREEIVLTAIHRAKEFYNVEKFDRIISVGDGLWDLLTAKNLNLEFIGIGLKNKKVLIDNGAELVLNDLREFEIK